MRRAGLILIALVPVILTATAFIALAQAAPPAQEEITPGQCVFGLHKTIDPDSLRLGDTSKVTMVMTHSCPSVIPPTDIVFLVDISNSMTKGTNPRLDLPCGPDPGADPLKPTEPLPPDPRETPGQEPTVLPPATQDPGGAQPTSAISSATRLPSLPVDPPTPGGPGGIFPTPGGPGGIFPTQEPPPPTVPGDPPQPTQGPGDPISTVPGVDPGLPGPQLPSEGPGNVELIREMQKLMRDFLKEPVIVEAAEQGRLRIGLVAFESRPHTISWPTEKLTRIRSGIGRLDNLPNGTTNASMGFYRAHQALSRGGMSSNDRNQVVVLMSDGKFDSRSIRGIRIRSNVQYMAMGMGATPHIQNLNNIVSDRALLIDQRDYDKLRDFHVNLLTNSLRAKLVNTVVQDELADNMRYVNGSGSPTITVAGQLLEWKFEPPADRITMTYRVEPLEAGTWPVSNRSDAQWLDTSARTGTELFPPVSVDVIGPTSTPPPITNTPITPPPVDTPTVVPTKPPTPTEIYLPILFKVWPKEKPPCIPQEHTVDVAIVIDTSDSMMEMTSAARSKLDAAIDAGVQLATDLKLDGGGDQVTVLGFNSQPTVMTGLSGSEAVVHAALRDLPRTQSTGTKINLALSAARVELTGPAHNPGNKTAIVLLTDGRHEGTAQEAMTAANDVKAVGIEIYAVGIGNADSDLLRSIASDASLYYYSPDGEDLDEIYTRIANVIPCP